MRALAVCFLFLAILAACSSAIQDSEAAREVLLDYFSALNSGQYSQAALRYGGSYQVLADNNPTLDPSDHTALWQNGCQINGFQCLAVRSAAFKEQIGNTFVYLVSFSNPDGSQFSQGACCGADPGSAPPVSQFTYRVVKSDAGYLVVDMPVYAP